MGHVFLKGIFALILKALNVLVHAVGLWLLRCLHRRGRSNVQMVYIINLCATELVVNLFSFIRNLLRVIPVPAFNSREYKRIEMYSYILDYAVFKFCLYMWMFYITIDRVCGVLLNLTYPTYWDAKRAKYLVTFTWLASFMIFTTSAVVYSFYPHANIFSIANYFIILFDVLFVIVAILSYASIFNVFQKTRKSSFLRKSGPSPIIKKDSSWKNGNPPIIKKDSLWKIFRGSRFYVSVLIVSTFMVFTIIPDFMWTFRVVRDTESLGAFLLSTSYAISYLIDGGIYIFMDDKVKRLLWRKLRFYTCFKDIVPNYFRKQAKMRYGVTFHKGGREVKEVTVELSPLGSHNDEKLLFHTKIVDEEDDGK